MPATTHIAQSDEAVAPQHTRRPVEAMFVRPAGREWKSWFPPDAPQPITDGCSHPEIERRTDGTYCTTCGALIYANRARPPLPYRTHRGKASRQGAGHHPEGSAPSMKPAPEPSEEKGRTAPVVPLPASTPLPLMVRGCMWCHDRAYTYHAYTRMPDSTRRTQLLQIALRSWQAHTAETHPDEAT